MAEGKKANNLEIVDSSQVGYFEAESVEKTETKKQRKLVKMNGLLLTGVRLPEQGSWHLERKKEILKKHPEIKQLFGTNPWTAVFFLISFTLHMSTCYWLLDKPWYYYPVVCYTFGALFSWQCATLAHEGAHGLVFSNRPLNKVFAIIAFLPTFNGPFGNFWSMEHMYHHQVVVDKMQRYGSPNNGPVKKALFALLFVPFVNTVFFLTSTLVFLQIPFMFLGYFLGISETPFKKSYGLPPYRAFPQIVNPWFVLNYVLSISFSYALYHFWGPQAVGYLFLSLCCANGLHPLGMRQVQEHYLKRKDQPTNSVYSIFNPILFNLGIHVEHHDFPQIPWSRLPQVRKIAPEYYNNLFSYKSYTQILIEFLTNPGIPLSVLLADIEGFSYSEVEKRKLQ